MPVFDPKLINLLTQFFWRKGQPIDDSVFDDNSVGGEKLEDGSVSAEKLDFDPATQEEIAAATTPLEEGLNGLSESVSESVSALGVAISTNTADIATNTADIATNTADIATNTADIAALDSTKSDVMLFPIWAEESQAGTDTTINGGNQWSFGNGDNTPSGDGIVLPFPAKLIAISLNIEGATASGTVFVEKSGTDVAGSGITLTTAEGKSKYLEYPTSFDFAAGDVVNFHSTATSGGTSARVTAFFTVNYTDL